jgi:hypothetical protein
MVEWSDLKPAAQWSLLALHERPRSAEQLVEDCPVEAMRAEMADGIEELRALGLIERDEADGLVLTADGRALASHYA